MNDSDQLLQTIEAVHAAGLDDTLWPDALGRTAKLLGALGATFEVFRKDPVELLEFRMAGLPPKAETDYLAHYARHNPRAQYAFRNLSQTLLCDYQFIDEREMDRNAYYAKYLTSIDLRYFLSAQIVNDAQTQGVISIQRTRRQGHVDAHDIARMQRLLPHFRQACDVARRLRSINRFARSFEQALEWMADGVAMVARDGRLIFANTAFEAVVRRGDGIAVRRGLVEFAAAGAQQRFAEAVHAAGSQGRGEHHPEPAVDFSAPRRGDGTAYLVSVRPIPRVMGASGPTAGVAAIVFVHDPLPAGSNLSPLLRETFGLTEAEAAVAEALRAGISLGDYARERRVSLNTIYTHLRRIKDKTGCRRLPDLVRRLDNLRSPARPA